MTLRPLILIAVLTAAAPWTVAADAPPVVVEQNSTADDAGITTLTVGEVRKVDLDQGKVTIKHGPIDNLGMPGMTMVFHADAAMLARLKAGDSIRFRADRVDGSLSVTRLVVL